MKTMIMCALALSIGLPVVASAAEADVVVRTHHRHHGSVKIINEEGQRLHHRRHGTVAFYDHGRRHHHRDTVVVTGSVSTHRHHHRHHPVVIENDGY
ncbi:hypothetical protein LB559_11765 [Mesorhizobium sp. BR1-1-3]|uniref:hypothetical protein n=1 Tax=Mesorhizobium sp. BR1-1-3 TaxID=2876651 RepID=UPI001CD0AEC2|nr:hypothetical protein [Mesorhizobium sp. BR1-1-3]MBZ9888621.1 hypothetical protein [Mesorhizobium sp. BR1-1-3]